MSDLIDKAILIGLGLEKKAKEALEELEQAGKAGVAAAPAAGEPLSPKQVVENKVVEEGIKTLKDFLGLVKSAKEKLDKEVSTGSGKVLGKLNVATQEDIEVVKEMIRVSREKIDNLDKRLTELEKIQKEGMS
jgi:BMFP domain-containing protein YqiC